MIPGWRVILGRGLDMFQKPEARFSLGFIESDTTAMQTHNDNIREI
jgi:hypothetical protein